MTSLNKAFSAIAAVLALHSLVILFGVYSILPWFDILMHFLGGAAIALLGMALWDMAVQKVTFTKGLGPYAQLLVHAVVIMGFVAIVGIVWEWYEFLFDYFVVVQGFDMSPSQPSIGDTMADFFFDLAGAVTVFCLFRSRVTDPQAPLTPKR